MKKIGLILLATLGFTACMPSARQVSTSKESHYEQLANLPFQENRPTQETAKKTGR